MRELEKLTAGERLLIERRRAGLNQSAMAERYGTGRKLYGAWERDECKCPNPPNVGKLQNHEVVTLYRRRAGFSRARVAREVGVSAFWVTQMERGQQPCDRLLEYWEQ